LQLKFKKMIYENKNKNKIIILVSILLVVTVLFIFSRDNEYKFNALAENLIVSLYNVSYSDGEELFGRTNTEEEWIELDEYLRDRYADLMTVNCYHRLATNKMLDSTHFVAYQKNADFKTGSINFKEKQEKYGEQYHVYSLDLVQYHADSKEIINKWIIEAYISYSDENGELKIKDLEIEMYVLK